MSLTVDGKAFGPYASDLEELRFDLDRGAFVARLRIKGAIHALTEAGLAGPFRAVNIAADAGGRLTGWIATATDGSMTLHRGGKSYGPYQQIDFRRAWLSPTGDRWLVPVREAGTGGDALLDTGSLMRTGGLDLKPMADGWFLFYRDATGERIMSDKGSWGPFASAERWLVTRGGMTWIAAVRRGEGPAETGAILVDGTEYPGGGLYAESGTFGERFSWIARMPDGSARLSWIVAP